MKNDKLHVRESLFLHLSFLIGHLSLIICEDILRVSAVRARQEIRCAFWRERRAGRCEAPRRRRCRCASSRSGNNADTRPSPPRPSGLRPAGPLALLLAPHIPPRLVARASPAGLGACSRMQIYFCASPKVADVRSGLAGKDGAREPTCSASRFGVQPSGFIDSVQAKPELRTGF